MQQHNRHQEVKNFIIKELNANSLVSGSSNTSLFKFLSRLKRYCRSLISNILKRYVKN